MSIASSALRLAGNRRFVITTISAWFGWSLFFVNLSIAEAPKKFERGITGSFTFKHDGPPLRAKVQRDRSTELVVRIQTGQTAGEYEVRFIGNVPGQFDLRDWLEHSQGSPVNGLAALPIEIVSTLPKDQRSDLFEVSGFQPQIAGGYRMALFAAVLAWLAVPALIVWRRIMASKPEEVSASEPQTLPLIDQLRPLIAAASAGQLSTNDQARLELLLLHYWRETENLPKLDMASSIQQLRAHAQAGPMISAVEAWLHGAGTGATTDSLQRVLELLKPMQPSATSESASGPQMAAASGAGSGAS